MSLNETISNLGDSIVNLVDKKRHGTLGLEQGKVGYDREVFEDIRKYKHSTFDKNKFEVVGNPNITEDGIASGFSDNNYLDVQVNRSGIISVTEDIVYVKPSYGYSDPLAFRDTNNNIVMIAVFTTTNNAIQISGGTGYKVLEENKKYKLTVETDCKTYSKMYIDGVFISSKTYTSDFTLETVRAGLSFGPGAPFSGSIDLKQFSITVDGREVFNGNKTGIDVIKEDNYTVVGNPTITEDGIASGFSSNDYVKTPYFPQPQKELIIKAKAIRSMEPNVSTYPQAMQLWHMSSTQWRLQLDSAVLKVYELKSGVEPTIHFPPLHGGELIETEVILRPNEQIINLWIDGVKYSTKENYELPFSSQFLSIPTSDAYYWTGSVDLNAYKIYVDGNLVYQPCLKIPYTLSKTGSKIVDEGYRNRVIDMYEQEGYTGYYTTQEGKKGNYAVVGSPTIVDGIASGFSRSNYINIPNTYAVTSTSNTEFNISISKTSNPSTSSPFMRVAKNDYRGTFGFLLGITTAGYLYTSGIIERSHAQLDNNRLYNIKLKCVEGVASVYLDGDLLYSDTYTTDVPTGYITIGAGTGSDYFQNGSIDLNALKIYIDGELVYRAITPPNYTLPMGDVYGTLSAKSNSSEISRYSMPSDKYIDLTLGASGSTYTAPANGWFNIHAKSTANNSYIEMYNSSSANFGRGVYGASGLTFKNAIEAKKGDVCTIFYANINTPDYFRFIYAEGEKQ